MAQARLETIHRGWKVYAGAEQVGEVSEIRDNEFEVRRGVLRKHTYALPAEFVADASDGIVDLNVDREVFEEREIVPEAPPPDVYDPMESGDLRVTSFDTSDRRR